MKKKIAEYFPLLACLVCVGVLAAVCAFIEQNKVAAPDDALSRILKRKTIRLITDNNANTYYLYRGQAMGFEYELASAFADFLNVKLEVVTPGWNSMIPFLETDKGDFIGAALTITSQRRKQLFFSQPYMEVQQTLVYHKSTKPVACLGDLNGKTIHVRRYTAYHERLKELKAQGIDLTIKVLDNVPTEEMIHMVAMGEIDYTVADSNIARLNRRYYPDIVVGIPLQGVEFIGWAVKPGDIRLMKKIEHFFFHINKTGFFAQAVARYYGHLEFFDYFDLKKFHRRLETRFPRYRQQIMAESVKYGFDWRMIAALVYQESHFDPRATSFTGVRGLMQVTEATALEMGITNRLDPKQSLRAGVKYLAMLYSRFDVIDDPHERMLFAMGSYNVGYGHILDAQKLARERHLDPLKWSSLEETLPLLSKRKYYHKTTYGYARGWEPVRHVRQILVYYDILRQKTARMVDVAASSEGPS